MALSIEEAQSIKDAAEKNNVVVMEGFTHRFQPQLAYVKRLIKDGEIGDIKIVRAEVIYPTVDWENDTRAQAHLGGCVTVEAGCYATNTIRYFMEDEPLEVTGYASQHFEGGIDTSFVGIFRFPKQRLGLMYTSMETEFRASAEIVGSRGRVEMPDLFGSSYITIFTQQETREKCFESPDRFTAQVEHFSNCILHGYTPEITLEDSLNNTRVLMALKYADK
jgi:D-xylose 1-dehydrogenase (NADP+, D-xylono-1,5-lactone-forming)